MSLSVGRLLLGVCKNSRKFRPNCFLNAKSGIHSTSVWNGKLVQFNLADIGEGIAEVQVIEWFVKPGDEVKAFDEICIVQSDKATVPISSRYTGQIKKLHYAKDEIALVGKPLVEIELEDTEEQSRHETSSRDGDQAEAAPSSVVSARPQGKALATPAVRRIAREHKVDLSSVSGKGRDGRVLKEDILRFIGIPASSVEMPGGSTQVIEFPVAPAPQQSVSAPKEDKVVPVRGYSRIMIKTMEEANKIPHFGYCDEVNVNKLVDLRSQLKSLASERGVKMTFMPLFIKAASLALNKYPILNSSLDKDAENIIYKASHNICVAMDTPLGLVVPNIKNCQEKNLWEIATDLSRLQEAGRKGHITQEDLTGGTFTLSNIGPIGGTYVNPVIFPPQVAIGALGQIQFVPRYHESSDKLVPTQIVRISWSADHRIIDGATMARYSNVWKLYLENPGLMIAEMK